MFLVAKDSDQNGLKVNDCGLIRGRARRKTFDQDQIILYPTPETLDEMEQ
jgi:hypothetical protein